tara:strand:+ start:306 stop:518 length:213 start_codon:yes stop_codon:yes gene_type:complete
MLLDSEPKPIEFKRLFKIVTILTLLILCASSSEIKLSAGLRLAFPYAFKSPADSFLFAKKSSIALFFNIF